ncbi:unnamed protein product [Nippostrongylus brasiliensis]|uniref:YqaE/Pmp3 family membrane protein n=1 Tax=Nippostrongylus brasiliensis TaxID=27835 RepID=A0A0N4Y369_NIPBR|nr:unnamed protein product [Nippostrongylus brasiliensis]
MCVVLLCILAFFCPPLAVLFDQGCTAQFWINFLLTLLIWVPGVIHALWVLLCREGDHRYHEYQRGH